MQQFGIGVKIFCASQRAGIVVLPFGLTSDQGRCKNGKKQRDQEGKEKESDEAGIHRG
jgi:hypothetical protein